MNQIKSKLNECVTETSARIEFVTDQLRSCPEGSLTQYRRNGKGIVYKETYSDGRRVRSTITSDKKLQIKLARKKVLNKKLEITQKINRVLYLTLESIRDLCDYDFVAFCRKTYPWMDMEMIQQVLKETDELDAWANEAYEKLEFKPETKRHITSRGLAVRSKSELLIAEMLYKYGIAFRYEQILHIDEFTYAPDFTIMLPGGKIIYWEHMGLMNNPKYIESQMRKEENYRKIGIVPWDNLIITYDSVCGDINLKIIESEIVNKLLI